jgi:hypothetical protein
MEDNPSDVGPRDHSHDSPHRRLERAVLGRADAARRLDEAHKLLEEVADMLTAMRKDLLGGRAPIP